MGTNLPEMAGFAFCTIPFYFAIDSLIKCHL